MDKIVYKFQYYRRYIILFGYFSLNYIKYNYLLYFKYAVCLENVAKGAKENERQKGSYPA
jgi:hypothetical protein